MRVGDVRARNIGARWSLFAGLLFLVDSSCAKMIPIPEAEYRETGSGKKATYRLTTREDRIYDFSTFAVTDSTLIILKGTAYGTTGSLHDASAIETPFVVPWSDVKSLERYKYWNAGTALVIVSGVIVVGFGLYVLFVIYAVSGALKGAN